jgi:hypothetical protein
VSSTTTNQTVCCCPKKKYNIVDATEGETIPGRAGLGSAFLPGPPVAMLFPLSHQSEGKIACELKPRGPGDIVPDSDNARYHKENLILVWLNWGGCSTSTKPPGTT